MLLQKKIEKRKRRRFQIGPATPGEVSGTKKRDNFLEKNPVKTVENYSFDRICRKWADIKSVFWLWSIGSLVAELWPFQVGYVHVCACICRYLHVYKCI